MNKNLVIGIIVLVVAVLLGLYISTKYRNNKNLPTGNMTNQTQPTTNTDLSQTPISTRPQVKISTSKGDIVVELRPDLAPKTVTNFLTKWSNGYCDGKTFHRVEDWVVQGCDPLGNGTGGELNLPTETSSENFAIGSLGVARRQFPKELSNDSQIFIVKKDSSFLNNDYTYFGKVISGMEVVNKLAIGDKILSTTILAK